MDWNTARERRAESAVEAYLEATPPVWQQSEQEVLCDLLTDLRHYCALNRLDFEEAIRLSRSHFHIERKEHEAVEAGLI